MREGREKPTGEANRRTMATGSSAWRHLANVTLLAVALGLWTFSGVALAAENTDDEPAILVVASKIKDLPDDHYRWAAEMAASRLKGPTKVLPGDFATALRYAREHKGQVLGIVEIIVDVYTFDEEVRITCFDPTGKRIWKESVSVNMGGSEEALARKMVERALNKSEDRPACGRPSSN